MSPVPVLGGLGAAGLPLPLSGGLPVPAVAPVATLTPPPPRAPRLQLYTEVPSRSRRAVERDAPELVRWRLLTVNHRCLGVSTTLHATSEEAHAAVLEVVRRAAHLTARSTCDAGQRWWWSVRLDGVEVARSARGYHRRIECDLALRQFVQLLGQATVYPMVLRFRRGGDGA